MPDWLLQAIAMGGAAVGVYAAIRADLAALHVKAELAAKSADRAHERIDEFGRECRNIHMAEKFK